MGNLMHLGATVICAHAGQAMPTSTSTRVRLSGQPAVNLSHTYTIAGCTFTTESPKPCATVQWITPATRVRIEGTPAILSTTTGTTLGPLGVQGTPQVVVSQVRVRGQ